VTLFGLSPVALATLIGLAAGGLFLLHLLRVRPEVKPVPTLLFWKEAVEETRARTLLGRFRHPRTYVFLTLLAALLAWALADPETDGSLSATRHVVVVLDNGPESGARLPSGETPGERVIDRILASADRVLASLTLKDRVSVLTVAKGAGMVAAFGEPRNAVRDRLRRLAPSRTNGDPVAAIRRAAALVAARSRPRVVFLTGPVVPTGLPVTSDPNSDGDTGTIDTGAIDPGEGAVPITLVRHGGGGPDQGALGVDFARTLAVRVTHTGPAPDRTLEVRRVGPGGPEARLAAVPVSFPTEPGSRWIPVPGVTPSGETVEIRLVPSDRYPRNDRIVYRLPRRERRRVFVDPTLPRAARLLVEANPRLERVNEPARAEVVLMAGAPATGPIAAGARPAASPRGLVQDGAGAPDLPRLGPGVQPLRPSEEGEVILAVAGRPIARVLRATPPRIELATGLLAVEAGFVRRAEGAAFLASHIERIAGNRPGAVVLPAAPDGVLALSGAASVRVDGGPGVVPRDERGRIRVGHLEPGAHLLSAGDRKQDLCVHAGEVLPADARPAPAELPEFPGSRLNGWEWLALAALALVLIDAWLHARGRIP